MLEASQTVPCALRHRMNVMGTIRKLLRSETGMITAHLLRLDPADRRMRFCSMVNDDYIRRYVDRLDWSRSLLFGQVEDGALRGLGELLLQPGDPPEAAEAAFSVERGWRNEGLCHRLMDRVTAAARVLAIATLHLYMLGENDPMRRVAGAKGFRFRLEEGEIQAILDLPRLEPLVTLEAEVLYPES